MEEVFTSIKALSSKIITPTRIGNFEIPCKYHVDCLDVQKDGNFVVAGLSNLDGDIWDGMVQLYSKEAKTKLLIPYNNHKCQYGVSRCKFIGTYIIAAQDNGNIIVFTANKLDLVGQIPAHSSIVSSLSVCGHPFPLESNKYFASGCWEGNIRVWSCESLSNSLDYANINQLFP